VSPEIVGLLGVVLGGGFIGAIAAWRTAGSESTKNEAGSQSILVETAMALLTPLRARIKELEAQIDECEARAAKLTRQLREVENDRRT
jgi:TolA-binding protein